LVDGQHRLSAIVMAGKPCEMYVATGIDSDSIYTIDTGKSRTTTDAMRILHPDDPTYRSATVIGTARIMLETLHCQTFRGRAFRISNSEVNDFVSKYYYVFKWLNSMTRNNRSGVGRGCATTFAIVCALSNFVDERLIKSYMECLYDNQIGISDNVNWKAALDYRTYLETLQRNKVSSRTTENLLACKKSIYLFANNISKTSKTNFYEFSEAKLEMLNEMLNDMLNDMLKETM